MSKFNQWLNLSFNFVLAFTLGGCAMQTNELNEPDEQVETATEEVVAANGTTVTETDFPAAVTITGIRVTPSGADYLGGGFASGILLNSSGYLTAAHAVQNAVNDACNGLGTCLPSVSSDAHPSALLYIRAHVWRDNQRYCLGGTNTNTGECVYSSMSVTYNRYFTQSPWRFDHDMAVVKISSSFGKVSMAVCNNGAVRSGGRVPCYARVGLEGGNLGQTYATRFVGSGFSTLAPSGSGNPHSALFNIVYGNSAADPRVPGLFLGAAYYHQVTSAASPRICGGDSGGGAYLTAAAAGTSNVLVVMAVNSGANNLVNGCLGTASGTRAYLTPTGNFSNKINLIQGALGRTCPMSITPTNVRYLTCF
jgi:hypothetical protein